MFPTLTTASCTLINRGTTIGPNHLIQPVLLLGCFVHLEILKIYTQEPQRLSSRSRQA